MSVTAPATDSTRPRRPFSEKRGTLYVQVADIIRHRIRSGAWGPGHQIPPLGDLEQEFGVARVTLRQALTVLESEELIWRQRGKGTFVTDKGGPEWCKLETSWDDLIRSLEGNWSRIIAVDENAEGDLLDDGDGEPAAAYRQMRRVHGSGSTAYAVVDMHLDDTIYARAPKRFEKEMIIPVLETLPGIQVGDLRQTLTIGTAESEVAEHLDVPIGSPIGIMRRVLRDAKGRVIYVGVVNYRGDLVKLEISLSNGKSKGQAPKRAKKP